MTSATMYPHLTMAEDGAVRIGTTRYKVLHLAAEHYHHGWSAEDLLRQHPDLRPEQVYSALAYFYDHFDELVEQLRSAAEAQEKAPPAPFSRTELLKRRDAKGE